MKSAFSLLAVVLCSRSKLGVAAGRWAVSERLWQERAQDQAPDGEPPRRSRGPPRPSSHSQRSSCLTLHRRQAVDCACKANQRTAVENQVHANDCANEIAGGCRPDR